MGAGCAFSGRDVRPRDYGPRGERALPVAGGTSVRRGLRRIVLGLAAWAAFAGGGAVLLLEIAYLCLLPESLPERTEALPAEVRDALWLDGHSTVHRKAPFSYPYLLSLLLANDTEALSTQTHVARLHDLVLRQQGLVPEKHVFGRQLQQVAVATWITRHWTTEEALDALGHHVYVGDDQFGLPDASRHYFGKPLRSLAPHELAALSALIKLPQAFHPACHPGRALKARNAIIERMKGAGLLDEERAQAAIAQPLHVVVECAFEAAGGEVG